MVVFVNRSACVAEQENSPCHKAKLRLKSSVVKDLKISSKKNNVRQAAAMGIALLLQDPFHPTKLNPQPAGSAAAPPCFFLA